MKSGRFFYKFIMKIMIIEMLEFIENYVDLFYINDVAMPRLLNADDWWGFYLAHKRAFFIFLLLFLRGAHKEKKHIFLETNEGKQNQINNMMMIPELNLLTP